MKTKIIYISGNEIFDMADIRSAFEEVRNALNLGPDTVLFGVPVDKEDDGFGATDMHIHEEIEPAQNIEIPEQPSEPEIQPETIVDEPVVETEIKPVEKKRKTSRKKTVITEEIEETTEKPVPETADTPEEEKIVPILSVLSNDAETDELIEETPTAQESDIEIIEDIVSETSEEIEPTAEVDEESESLDTELPEQQAEEDAADLEKLLSAITPLQEDFMEDKEPIETPETPDSNETENIDATLEQLATEYVANQDKIKQEAKSNTRSKIGKLRNILPFKQSKNKDSQGLDNLFGWAGLAANDEDFSVPGFFTNVASKK